MILMVSGLIIPNISAMDPTDLRDHADILVQILPWPLPYWRILDEGWSWGPHWWSCASACPPRRCTWGFVFRGGEGVTSNSKYSTWYRTWSISHMCEWLDILFKIYSSLTMFSYLLKVIVRGWVWGNWLCIGSLFWRKIKYQWSWRGIIMCLIPPCSTCRFCWGKINPGRVYLQMAWRKYSVFCRNFNHFLGGRWGFFHIDQEGGQNRSRLWAFDQTESRLFPDRPGGGCWHPHWKLSIPCPGVILLL